jgi:hypothetical protein
MKLDVLDNKDFWSGLMLIVIGGGAVLIARNYPFGSSLRMGPGYFPIVLGSILALFGLFFVARAVRSTERVEPGWSPRALIVISLALVLFGILMTHAGFVPALLVLIFGSAAASTEFKLGEVLLLSVGLTAFCVLVFIWGLGLPYPLIADF